MSGSRRTTAVAALLIVLVPAVVTGCGDSDSAATTKYSDPDASRHRLVILTDGGVILRPSAETPGDRGSRMPADRTLKLSGDGMHTVHVPGRTAVKVTARNGGIDARDITGDLDLTTVNGDVTVRGSGGTVRLATRNGSVRASGLRAARLTAATVNGDVLLGCATAPGTTTATTVNGSVRLTVPRDAPAYAVRAGTSNGRPHVTVPTLPADGAPVADRRITLNTVNGDVWMSQG
jgi:DUF4097 and DUF4098 domain-containing protein YvlB